MSSVPFESVEQTVVCTKIKVVQLCSGVSLSTGKRATASRNRREKKKSSTQGR